MIGYLLKDKRTGYYYDFIEDDFVCIADKQCVSESLEFAQQCKKELKDFDWDCEIIETNIKVKENNNEHKIN